MPRTLQQLRDDGQFSELTRTLRGQVPGVPNPSTAAVARRFGITESAVEDVRVALTTPAPKPVTESAPAAASTSLADLRPQVLEAAKEVAIGANVADAKLAAGKGDTLTHNELSSLAALLFPA